MKPAPLLAAVALAAFALLPAAAQEPLNMVGIWKGMATVAQVGANPYRVAQGNGPSLPAPSLEFTYTIKEQQGNRFVGEASGGKFTETLIGAVRPDNSGGIMLDDDGQYLFTVTDANTLSACYNHSFATSRVVGCWELKRQ